MATKHAKILEDVAFARLVNAVRKGSHPERDEVMVLLSFKAGLRAQEIAGLDWTDVTDAEGNIRRDMFLVPSDIAKKGRERWVPMHPELVAALIILRDLRRSGRGVVYGVGQERERMSPVAVRVWFHRLYQRQGLDGCSSHSGRRTFITRLARRAGMHDCSIKDVQNLAGHAYLSTTEAYIEPSPNVGRLVAAI